MHRVPLIGITVSPRSPASMSEEDVLAYCRVVADAGGLPLLVPLIDQVEGYANALDGWLIAGGRDIDPASYGEAAAPETVPIAPLRYEFEKRLWPVFEETGKPILGVCYGCQFLNVQLSGSLVQHIPVPSPGGVSHRTPDSKPAPHRVKLVEGSLAHRTCGELEFESSSSHHQSIARVGSGLRVTAYAPDDVIEAVEVDDGRWILGVQWHPERTPDSPSTRSLLASFVREAAGK